MKKTATVGIPAHNEARNIENLLRALLKQKETNFTLKKIIVICDGCTDNTEKIVTRMKKVDKRITLIRGGDRLGKNKRLNQLYKLFTTDILITVDADIQIKQYDVLECIVNQFSNTRVGLVGGKTLPVKQTTLIGKSLFVQEYFWHTVIESIASGNNVHSHTGPLSAGSRKFLQSTTIPENVPDDHFLYFEAIKRGFLYKYAKNAHVYIKVPTTFSDYMKQSTRFINSAEAIRSYFGKLAKSQYAIPKKKKIQAYVAIFKQYPLMLLVAIFLTIFQRLFGKFYTESNNNGLWTPVLSSK